MRFFLFIIILIPYPLSISAEELDDWSLGDEKIHAFSLRYGEDEDSGLLIGASLTTPFVLHSTLNLYYTEVSTELESRSDSIEHYGFNWSSDNLQTWSAGLFYGFTGTTGVIEIEELGAHARYSLDHWFVQLKYVLGDIKGYTVDSGARDRLIQRIQRRFGRFVSVDQHGYGFLTGLQTRQWSWQVGYTDYHYSHDLSRIDSSAMQYYLKRGVMDQVFQLSNEEFYTDVIYNAKNHSLTFGYNSYELSIDNSVRERLYTRLDLSVSDGMAVGVLINYSLDDSIVYGEFSLTMYW